MGQYGSFHPSPNMWPISKYDDIINHKNDINNEKNLSLIIALNLSANFHAKKLHKMFL